MTITMKNVDFQLLEVLKDLVKMKKGVEIVESSEPKKAAADGEKYSSRLENFRAKYADLLKNPENAEEIDNAFENLRDYNEPLRKTADDVWKKMALQFRTRMLRLQRQHWQTI